MLCDLYFHCQQIFVLMYKDFLLMKRRYVLTAFFLLIPTFIACIPVLLTRTLDDLNPVIVNFYQDFVLRGKFAGRNAKNIREEYKPLMQAQSFELSNDSHYDAFDIFSLKINKMHTAFRQPKLINSLNYMFMYSPDNNVTLDLMQQSVTLWVKRMNISTAVSILAFENEFELETVVFWAPNSTYLIGTVFQNIDDYLPDSLEYKIRVGAKDEFYVCEHSDSGRYAWIDDFYVETFFLGWQTALEQTFVNLAVESNHSKVAAEKILNSVYLNPFPVAEKALHPKRMFLKQVWPFTFGFAFFIFACCVVAQLTMEKESEVKTMLVIMRMKRSSYWLSFFIRNLLIGTLIVFFLSCCYKFLVPNEVPLFENASLGIIYCLLMSFFVKLILFCMVFSIFFRNTYPAIVGLLLFYLLTFGFMGYLCCFKEQIAVPSYGFTSKFLMCFLPTTSIFYEFDTLFSLPTAKPLCWSTVWDDFGLDKDLILLFLANLSSFTNLILAIWYFDAVWPFQHGRAKLYIFPLMLRYWFPPSQPKQCFKEAVINNKYFEKTSSGARPGVSISNLLEHDDDLWTQDILLDRISLNVYFDKITVLVDYDFAGKKSLMNLLNGLYEPIEGEIYVNGWDVVSSVDNCRKDLGFCGENEVLYEQLTVYENLKIFGGIKGIPWRSLNKEAEKMAKLLLIKEEENIVVKDLPNASKRKLSVSIALLNNPKVLCLDRPTENLNPQDKRMMWKLLHTLKKDRAILVTSCNLEEIEELGDAVAILTRGKLECYGSTCFLKKALGTGCILNITKKTVCNILDSVEVIKKYFKGAILQSETERNASIFLDCNDFDLCASSLLKDLNDNKSELRIESFTISGFMFEFIFTNERFITYLKRKDLMSVETKSLDAAFKAFSPKKNDTIKASKALSLYKCHLTGLFTKKMKLTWRLRKYYLAFVVFLFISVTLIVLSSEAEYESPPYLDIKVTYGCEKKYGFIVNSSILEEAGLSSMFQNALTDNFISLQTIPENISANTTILALYLAKTENIILGISSESNPTHGTIFLLWYNKRTLDILPVAVNILHSAFLRNYSANSALTLRNHPLPFVQFIPHTIKFCDVLILVGFSLICSLLGASFIVLPVFENSSSAKLLQLITGLSAFMYWFSMFLCDILVNATIVFLVMIPLFMHSWIAFHHFLIPVDAFVLLLLFGLSIIPLCYILSLFLSSPGKAFACMWMYCISLGAVNIVNLASKNDILDTNHLTYWLLRFFPGFCFFEGAVNTYIRTFLIPSCIRIPFMFIEYFCRQDVVDHPLIHCCKEENIFRTTLDLYIVIVLLLNMLVVFISLIFLENAFDKMYSGYIPFQGYLDKSVGKQDNSQEDIINEANRIKHLIADGDTTEILKVIDLSKKVQGKYIVDHLTFSVAEGDCLGIIGAFGVGKSATMAMLSGAISPSKGNAYIKDSSLIDCLKRFQTFIGYCPQRNTLLNLLTGFEMLTLFANLRGVSDEAFVKLIIRKMDLQDDGTTLIKNYSFGDKRKLAVAVAAMGMPPVMLLDEPTTGVDFESQRKILQFIKELVDTKTQAIVFASSSVFDCQEVCTRFAVMDNGRFQHLCSMPQLEEKYSSGYMMTIILKMEKQDDMNFVLEVIHCIECNIPGSMLMKFDKGVFIYRISHPDIELYQLCKFMQFLNEIFEFHKYFVTDISFIRVSFAHTLIKCSRDA